MTQWIPKITEHSLPQAPRPRPQKRMSAPMVAVAAQKDALKKELAHIPCRRQEAQSASGSRLGTGQGATQPFIGMAMLFWTFLRFYTLTELISLMGQESDA